MKKHIKWTEQSPLRYVLVVGVAYWGSFTAVGYALVRYFTGEPLTPNDFFGHLVVFWIAGVFFGLAMWFFEVRKRKEKAEADRQLDGGNKD